MRLLSNGVRFINFLLVGMLSMFFTEVYAGSAPLWFVSPWCLLFVFPLYLMHLLLFFNIAIRTKRTSVGHLYLFGVLIALYESWITKVLWTGYPGSEGPLMGTIFGVAALEFYVLVFFWHPIFAFVLPILVFEALAISDGSNMDYGEKVIPSHLSSLEKNPRLLSFLAFTAILGAGFLSLNTGHSAIIADTTILGSILLIFLFFHMARRNPSHFSIHSLQLKNEELAVVAAYLFPLYAFSFLFLDPDKVPSSSIPILMIIIFYALVGLLIKTSPACETLNSGSGMPRELLSSREFFEFCLLFLLLTSVFCVVPVVGEFIALKLNLVLFVGGPFFFVTIVMRLFQKLKHVYS